MVKLNNIFNLILVQVIIDIFRGYTYTYTNDVLLFKTTCRKVRYLVISTLFISSLTSSIQPTEIEIKRNRTLVYVALDFVCSSTQLTVIFLSHGCT